LFSRVWGPEKKTPPKCVRGGGQGGFANIGLKGLPGLFTARKMEFGGGGRAGTGRSFTTEATARGTRWRMAPGTGSGPGEKPDGPPDRERWGTGSMVGAGEGGRDETGHSGAGRLFGGADPKGPKG